MTQTKKIPHRQLALVVRQLRACAASREKAAREVAASIADIIKREKSVVTTKRDVTRVHDDVVVELEQVEMLLEDGADVERMAFHVERGHWRAAFKLYEAVDTDVRETVGYLCPAFLRFYEADPKTIWRRKAPHLEGNLQGLNEELL